MKERMTDLPDINNVLVLESQVVGVPDQVGVVSEEQGGSGPGLEAEVDDPGGVEGVDPGGVEGVDPGDVEDAAPVVGRPLLHRPPPSPYTFCTHNQTVLSILYLG